MRMRLGQYQLAFDVVPAIGIYVIRERDLSVDAMYDRANLAAKQCKGNYIENYAFYVDEMREDIVREQQIVNHMRHALDEEEFRPLPAAEVQPAGQQDLWGGSAGAVGKAGRRHDLAGRIYPDL